MFRHHWFPEVCHYFSRRHSRYHVDRVAINSPIESEKFVVVPEEGTIVQVIDEDGQSREMIHGGTSTMAQMRSDVIDSAKSAARQVGGEADAPFVDASPPKGWGQAIWFVTISLFLAVGFVWRYQRR
jgi:hypothetical protein